MNTDKQYTKKLAGSYSEAIKEKGKFSRSIYYTFLDFPMAGRRVLDAGCGDGTELAVLVKKQAKVFGIDASAEMVSLAQESVPQAQVCVGDFNKLPYKKSFFDVVITKHAIQTTHSVETVLKEFARILKPGGILIMLSVHPMRQFLEKRRARKDYFKQELVTSILFDGAVTVIEPSHTFGEYLCTSFLNNFEILEFNETYDPYSAERVEGDIYPGFFIIKAQNKRN